MDDQTTRGGRQRLSRPRRWCQRGMRTAALSLALTAGAASGLTAAPAWAAGRLPHHLHRRRPQPDSGGSQP
jgi:hypothetical protein